MMNPPLDTSPSIDVGRLLSEYIFVVGCYTHHGRLPERPMGADCKSVGLRLPRFESWICHPVQRLFPALTTTFSVGIVRRASAAESKATATASKSSGKRSPCLSSVSTAYSGWTGL